MSGSNQNCAGIFIIVSLRIFTIIIFIRIWLINYYQEQIVILRGVLDDIYKILSEILGNDDVRILVLLPHGRLADGHPPPITYFFSLNIARVDGIDYTIIIILEMDPPILLQEHGFDFLIIFLGVGVLPIFLNVGTELPHRRRLPISRRLTRRVPKFFLENIPIIYGIPIVTIFRDLGIAIDNCLFLQAFNFGPVPLDYTQRGKE